MKWPLYHGIKSSAFIKFPNNPELFKPYNFVIVPGLSLTFVNCLIQLKLLIAMKFPNHPEMFRLGISSETIFNFCELLNIIIEIVLCHQITACIKVPEKSRTVPI